MSSFTGRSIPDPGFAGDSGAADVGLDAALRVAAADPARRPEVLAALHRARVLTPVVAVLGEARTSTQGLTQDKTSDMALPLLVADDGAKAVPVFSSVAALAAWDRSARPVPVEAARAAAVAIAEGAEAMVLDVASPHRATLRMAELRALVQGRGTVPLYADEAFRLGVHRALAGVAEVQWAWLEPWTGADARLTVQLAAGVDVAAAPRLVAGAVRDLVEPAVVRGLDLALLGAEAEPPAGRKVYARPS